jgi:hypothetical protein
MSKRDEFVASMKSQLDEWGAELHKLEAKAGNAEAHLSERYRQAVAALRQKHLATETKLEEIRHSGEQSWEELKDEAERTWVAFKAGLDAFREFSDHS